MIQNVLHTIGGVGIYGVVSISIFFIVFTGMLVWAFSLKKNALTSMGEVPLHDGSNDCAAKGEIDHE